MAKVLIFSCISAVMLVIAAYGATISIEKKQLLTALIKDLENLEKNKDKIHLDFYTPTEKQECSRRTLQCYLTEMGILENEVDAANADDVQNIKKNLQNLMDLLPHGTKCKTCEANDKKKFPAFHKELSNFLKSMLK